MVPGILTGFRAPILAPVVFLVILAAVEMGVRKRANLVRALRAVRSRLAGVNSGLYAPVLLLAFFLPAALAVLTKPTLQPDTDYWVHVAVIRALAEGQELETVPLAEKHMVEIHRHRDPHHVLWARVMRRTGMSVSTTMAVAGVVNLAVFICGVWFLARALSSSWAMPVALCTAMFFLVGQGYYYSSAYHYAILPVVASYTSTLGWGVSFFALGLVLSWVQRGGLWRLGAASVLTALVINVHALTAVMFALPFPVLWVWTSRTGRRQRLLSLAYPVVACVLSLAWPYNFVFHQAARVSTHTDLIQVGGIASSVPLIYPDRVLLSLGPALAGLVFCFVAPRRWRRQITTCCVLYGAGWIGATFLGLPLGHRLVFVFIFALQLAIATTFASRLRILGRRLREGHPMPVTPALAAICILLIPWGPYHLYRVWQSATSRVSLIPPGLRPAWVSQYDRAMQEVRRDLPESARVMSDSSTACYLAAFGVPVIPDGGMFGGPGGVIDEEYVRTAAARARELEASHLLIGSGALSDQGRSQIEKLGRIVRVEQDMWPGFVLVDLTAPGEAGGDG